MIVSLFKKRFSSLIQKYKYIDEIQYVLQRFQKMSNRYKCCTIVKQDDNSILIYSKNKHLVTIKYDIHTRAWLYSMHEFSNPINKKLNADAIFRYMNKISNRRRKTLIRIHKRV
jgi:hypothetical protein